MNIRLKLAAFLGVVLTLAGFSDAQEAKQRAGDRLFLWKVTSPTNTAYLLGSIHVATKDFYPLPAEIEKAYAASAALAVEVDLTKVDAAAMQAALMERGTYPVGDSVAQHVPKDTLAKMREYFDRKGMPGGALEQFRPWALALTITMLEMQAMGYSAEHGIDKHFMDAQDGKPIIELESAEAQIELLSGFPEKLEAEFLGATLDSMEDSKKLMGQMVQAWKTGDVALLERVTLTEPLKQRPDLKGVYAKMFDERNARMTEKIEGFLKKREQPHFVVVGAGHLIGGKGILKLLEKRGYQVEQLTRDAAAPAASTTEAAKQAEPGAAAPADAPAAGPASKPRRPVKTGYAPADAWAK